MRNSSAHMVQAYAEMRTLGHPVRSPSELLEAAGQDLRQRFGIKSVSARTPQNVVREMRAARGFSNDEGHVAAARSAPSEAEEKRREKVRAYIAKANKARGFNTFETYE